MATIKRSDADQLAQILSFALTNAHLDAINKNFTEEEQRAAWTDAQIQKRMAGVRAESIEVPIEIIEFFIGVLRGETRLPRGRSSNATQRVLKALAKSEYETRLAAAKAAGTPDAKNVVLEAMAEGFGITADRVSQMVWPRRAK